MAEARSKGACWTCKLRKKKCDETHPSCTVCNSFLITCYGYGKMPAWMNDEQARKGMVESIQQQVKETANRNRIGKLQASRIQPQLAEKGKDGDSSFILPKASNVSLVASQFTTGPEENTAINHSPPDIPRRNPEATEKTLLSQSHDVERGIQHGLSNGLGQDEAILLMHYLDHVFPLQFPFYRPTQAEGGRGWLLCILMRTKPLYHAALSLAAFHQHIETYYDDKAKAMLPAGPELDELERHYNLALETLRHHLKEFSSTKTSMAFSDQVQLLVCMSFLISLEVFRGTGDRWQIHFKAASTVVSTTWATYIKAHKTQSFALHEAAMRFFIGILAWYDILSCATNDSGPFSKCDWLNKGIEYLGLDKLMGCENWVMLSIRDITALDCWKARMQENNQLSILELASRASRIEAKLENGLEVNFNTANNPDVSEMDICGQVAQTYDSFLLEYGSKDVRPLVTRIFACSALVYLHTVVSGANPDLPEIHQNVSRAIAAFQALSNPNLVRGLAWPMCIAGCMASREQRNCFRDIASRNNIDRFAFGSSKHAFNIMEECWKMQDSDDQENGATTWKDAMKKLNLTILLV